MRSYLGDIPNAHVRDFQRQKVYDAEEQCNFWKEGIAKPPLSLDEVENVVIKMSDWASIQQPSILYETPLAYQSKLPMAYATATALVLPFSKASTLPYLCHEMAHVINYNSENADHHGKHFTYVYLNLVKEFISPMAAVELRKSFKIKRVKYVRA